MFAVKRIVRPSLTHLTKQADSEFPDLKNRSRSYVLMYVHMYVFSMHLKITVLQISNNLH